MAYQPTSDGGREDNIRVQLDLSPRQVQRFEWIMQVCDLQTRKELFNVAVTLLEWAAKESMAGRRVLSLDERTTDRDFVSMPALSAATQHGLEAREAMQRAQARNGTDRAHTGAAALVDAQVFAGEATHAGTKGVARG